MVSLIEETGLFMGMSLVDTTKTLIPVTLLNLGEETKQLPRGLPVGVVEQVEETSVRRDKGTPIAVMFSLLLMVSLDIQLLSSIQ